MNEILRGWTLDFSRGRSAPCSGFGCAERVERAMLHVLHGNRDLGFRLCASGTAD